MPIHTEFVRSAIRVAWRFAYEDVLALVEDQPTPRVRDVPKPIRGLVDRMHDAGHDFARPAVGGRGDRLVAASSQARVR